MDAEPSGVEWSSYRRRRRARRRPDQRARGLPPLACLSGARGADAERGSVAGAMGGADGTGESSRLALAPDRAPSGFVCFSRAGSAGILGFGFWWGLIGRLASFGGFCPLMWLVAVFNFRMPRGPIIYSKMKHICK
jgi:hypothetical protein